MYATAFEIITIDDEYAIEADTKKEGVSSHDIVGVEFYNMFPRVPPGTRGVKRRGNRTSNLVWGNQRK